MHFQAVLYYHYFFVVILPTQCPQWEDKQAARNGILFYVGSSWSGLHRHPLIAILFAFFVTEISENVNIGPRWPQLRTRDRVLAREVEGEGVQEEEEGERTLQGPIL
jgi:hypothetical protein